MTRAERIAQYMNWEQGHGKNTDPVKKVFHYHNFSVHLIGKKNVLLVGHGISREMSFYEAAIYVMEWEMRGH